MRNILLFLFVAAARLSMAQTIAGGGAHSVFACTDGTVNTCGYNMQGQLGLGNNTGSHYYPSQPGLNNVTAVSAGTNYSLFLKSDGTVWACGLNDNGQLGDGTEADKNVPVKINSLSGIVAIVARGAHSIFLKNDGTVWACGSNNCGQLGIGSNVDTNKPVQISGLTNIIAIAGGAAHSLFLRSDSTVWSCGFNGGGELGDSTTMSRYAPVPVKISGKVSAIAAGTSNATSGAHSLFLRPDHTVWACGSNLYGQLGQGATSFNPQTLPIKINALSGVTAIAGGYDFSLFLKTDGTVWACGRNDNGSIGDSTTTTRPAPVQVHLLSGVNSIAAGWFHAICTKSDGSVWSWGSNGSGQLGNGTSTTLEVLPVQVMKLCQSTSVPHDPAVSILSVSPNPVSTHTVIRTDKAFVRATFILYDSYGRVVRRINDVSGNSLVIYRGDLPAGMYIFRVYESSGAMAALGKLIMVD